MAIKIDFLANVVNFLRGTRDVGRALDDVADALDDVADDATRTGRDLGDEITDGARDAERSTERLERSFRDLTTTARRESREAGDAIKRNVGGGLDDLKSEASQSGREAAASFSGGFDDVADFAQETIANGLGGFGPIGAAAGIALAAGVGAGFTKMQEDAEATKQFVNDAFEDMAETGASSVSRTFLADQMKTLLQDEGKVAEIRDVALRTRLSEQTVLLAMVGDQQAMADVLAAENTVHDEKLRKLGEQAGANADNERIVAEELQKHADIVGRIDATATGLDTAAGKAAILNGALGTSNTTLDAMTRKIQDAAAKLDGIGDKTVHIRADTTGLDGALASWKDRNSVITVNMHGQITKVGQMVW